MPRPRESDGRMSQKPSGPAPGSGSAARESPSPRLEAVVDRVGGVSGRLSGAWRQLTPERRLAALAAVGLFLALFLPWYQETVIARGVTSLRSLSASMSGWGAFSFVEAAVLLVAVGVLGLLFTRAEGQAFHVPGGDGGVITTAGLWTCVLIIWRMFDKQGTTGHGLYTTTSGIEWGIFVALAVAGLLTYAGNRIRLAHDPEPPLPGEAPGRRARRRGRGQPRRSGPGRTDPARASATSGTEPAVPRPERPGSAGSAGSAWPGSARPESARPGSPPEPRSGLRQLDLDETWIQVEHTPAPDPPGQPTPEQPRRRPRSLGRLSDVDLDLADPPASPLRPGRAPERDPDDQLTARLDRPE